MSNLARQEMYFDRFLDLDEILRRIEEVSVEDISRLANDYFRTDAIAVTVLGDLDGMKISREMLAC
jgi:predicted Zn-dependent peptidase